LSSNSGTSTGLSEVRWTRTTVGGPNYLGGSVTAAVTGELICSSRRVEGEARGGHRSGAQLTAVKIFTGRCLSDGHGARITASGNQRRRAGGVNRDLF
jgi:hypothetical protein